MDLITLLTAGPTVIRAVGRLFGGKTADVADTVAGVVDSVSALPPALAKQKIAQHLAQMPPEQLIELKSIEAKLAEIEKEREAARLAAETAQHAETQSTARVEAQSDDAYVRRTRPKLARHSAYFAFGYAMTAGVGFQIANVVYGTSLPGVDTWIVGTLFAPCLTYMGVRSVDAFSNKGKT